MFRSMKSFSTRNIGAAFTGDRVVVQHNCLERSRMKDISTAKRFALANRLTHLKTLLNKSYLVGFGCLLVEHEGAVNHEKNSPRKNARRLLELAGALVLLSEYLAMLRIVVIASLVLLVAFSLLGWTAQAAPQANA